MHEMGIVSGVLGSVIPVARDASADRICSVRLRVGDMREVVPETLMFAWEVLREDDPLTREADLSFEEVHPESACEECGAVSRATGSICAARAGARIRACFTGASSISFRLRSRRRTSRRERAPWPRRPSR